MNERVASPIESPFVCPAIEIDVDDVKADLDSTRDDQRDATNFLDDETNLLLNEEGSGNMAAEPTGEVNTELDNMDQSGEDGVDVEEDAVPPSSPLPQAATTLNSSDDEGEKPLNIAKKTSKILIRRTLLDDSDDEPDTTKPTEKNDDDSFLEKNGLNDLDLFDNESVVKSMSAIEREIDFRRNMLQDSDDESVKGKDVRSKSGEKSMEKDRENEVDSSDSEDDLKGKKSLKVKPERQSKKKALEEMTSLHKESQRLARETKVALPYHTSAALSLDQFFDLMKPAEKPVSKKPSFIDIDLGDDEPLSARPTKLDLFINRFLTHARQPVPKPTTVKPPEAKPVVQAQISIESMGSMQSMDNLFESMPPVDLPAVEKTEAMSVVKELPKEVPVAKHLVYDLPVLTSQLQNQKPGAKLSLLKAALEVGINEKKERFIQRQQEEYARQKALEPQEEEVENEEEEADAEFSDDDGGSCSSGESEPDEAEIVDENYGKDEPEPESNDFADNEAEECDDGEEDEDCEDEFDEGDVDLEKASDGSDDDEEFLDEKDRRAAVDDDDDDPLAGLVATQPVPQDSDDEGDDTSRHFTLATPGNVPGSLIDDMDPTQRAKLLRLCSFSSQNNLTQSSQAGSSPRFDNASEGFLQTPVDRANDIMGTFDNAEERDELMGLLSCPSADFKTAPPVRIIPARKYDAPKEPEEDDDGPLMRRQPEASKKVSSRRARVMLDDDDEEPTVDEEEPDKETTEKDGSDKTPALDDETDEEVAEPIVKRRIRVEEESDDDEDAEEEEVDDYDDEEENSREPLDDDEEGAQEHLERQFRGKAQRVKASDFLEEQAEESEDEFYRGSGDEDEDAMDELNQDDLDAVDDSYISLSKQMKQAMPEYMRKLAEDDQEREEYLIDRIQALQEDENLPQMPVSYFGDGATFKLNMDGDCVSDEEDNNKEDEVADNAWRVRRFERDQALASLEVDDPTAEDDDVLLKDNPFSVFSKKIRTRENADISFEMQSESVSEEPAIKANALFRRNSILSRGGAVLARLNEVIDVEERSIMPAALIALQNGSTRKGLKIDGDRREKLQRTESCPADASDGPSAKRRRTDYTQISKKPSVFSLLGH